jgi:RNA polymerase sigma-70 factor, ECF subfamily
VKEDVSIKIQCAVAAPEDAALAARLRAQPAAACAEVYSRFADQLYWFIFAQVRGDAETAADLLVETLSEAMRDIRRFDPDRSSLSAWLHGVARRRVICEYRKRSRRKSIPSNAQVPLDTVAETSSDMDLAAAVISRFDARQAVLQLAEVLTELELAVLVLAHVEEFSRREIGQIVGRSEAAVAAILHRAKQKAQERLGESHD